MKKTILIVNSLVDTTFDVLIKHIENMVDNHFLIFKGFDEVVKVCNVKEAFHTFKTKLEEKGLSYEEVTEYSFDEYIINHPEETIYITPTKAFPIVIHSAALLGFKGKMYLYSNDNNGSAYKLVTNLLGPAGTKASMGRNGLDTSPASFAHVEDRPCYFTLEGRKHSQRLKSRERVNASGVEGYTMCCEDNPKYRLKIWDRAEKRQCEIDKVEMMIKDNLNHENIGLPISFVYNENDEPIGYVMKNFDGEMFELSKMPYEHSISLIRSMLESMIWMESRGMLHRDVIHNMMVSADGKELYIIDIDSIQYNVIPATASTADPNIALPVKYGSSTSFYNTIEISYTMLVFLIACFVDTKQLFGVWDSETGFSVLNKKVILDLECKSHNVAQLVLKAHKKGIPVSLSEQLSVVNELLHKGKFKVTLPSDESEKEYEYDEDSAIEYDTESFYDDFSENSLDFETIEKASNKVYTSAIIDAGVRSKTGTTFKRMPEKQKKPDWVETIITFIIDVFMKFFMSGTVAEGQTHEELREIFIKDALWKKPVYSFVITVILIVVMIIGIIQL